MTPYFRQRDETLAEWIARCGMTAVEGVLKREREKYRVRWRFCIPCDKRYKSAKFRCPVCQSRDTVPSCPREADCPAQEALFVIPPPPAPNAWRVEWRWTAKPRKGNGWQRVDPDWRPEPPNPWQTHSHYNITCLKSAKNTRRRMAHLYPCKDFRVTAVSWDFS
jgi:hypothetical protein